MWIAFRDFHGLVPRVRDPREIPQGYAQIAQNCLLEGGTIRPIKGMTKAFTPAKEGTKKTIYYYKDGVSPVLFHWTKDVDVIRSIIQGDVTGLCIFTGDDYPRITTAALATSGGEQYPNSSFKLGVPAPASAPSVEVQGDAPTDPEVVPEIVSYRYCFVNKSFSAYYQKGPLSSPSEVVEAYFSEGQSVQLSSLDTSMPGSGWNSSSVVKQIYRAAAGYTTATWILVAEIPLNQATYIDVTPTASLPTTVADNEEFYPPSSNMIGIKTMPNGVNIGFYKNTVYPSEPWQPHAYPPNYAKPVDWPIVGLEVIGQTGVIITEGQPYLLMGSHPLNMTLTKLTIGHPGRSKRGIVEINGVVLYPATDGIAMVSLENAGLASEGLLDRTSWANYTPGFISAWAHSDWYIGFNTSSGFMFHPGTKEFVTINTVATAGYQDKHAGNLYLQVGDDVYKWDDDSNSPMTLTYKTRPERVPYPCCMSCGMVLAKDYPVTFRIYGDGVLRNTVTVQNGDPFWMKGGYLAREYEIEVSGTNEVIWFGVGETVEDIWEGLRGGI